MDDTSHDLLNDDPTPFVFIGTLLAYEDWPKGYMLYLAGRATPLQTPKEDFVLQQDYVGRVIQVAMTFNRQHKSAKVFRIETVY